MTSSQCKRQKIEANEKNVAASKVKNVRKQHLQESTFKSFEIEPNKGGIIPETHRNFYSDDDEDDEDSSF